MEINKRAAIILMAEIDKYRKLPFNQLREGSLTFPEPNGDESIGSFSTIVEIQERFEVFRIIIRVLHGARDGAVCESIFYRSE